MEESLKWRTYLEVALQLILKIIMQSVLGGIDDLSYSNQLFVSYQKILTVPDLKLFTS